MEKVAILSSAAKNSVHMFFSPLTKKEDASVICDLLLSCAFLA